MASNGGRSDGSESLPPSAAYVLDKIEAEGSATRQELLAATYLCERTLDRALETLQNGDYITLDRDSEDLRQVVATLADKRSYNPPESDRSR